jgi:formate-dependent nitrite reductase membrane component NrfD
VELWKDVIVPVLAAAIGTAAGATVAFLVERQNRRRDCEDRDIAATNAALFALFRVFNDL